MKCSLSGGSVKTWVSLTPGNLNTIKLLSTCPISPTQFIKININTCFTALLYFSRARKREEFSMPNPIQGHSPKTTKLEGKKKTIKFKMPLGDFIRFPTKRKRGAYKRVIERYKR